MDSFYCKSATEIGMCILAASLGAFASAQNIVELSELGTVYPGFRIEGINSDDNSGLSVSGAGDVNGDGLSDLIIGAKGADPNSILDAGESYVVFGKIGYASVSLASLGAGGFRIAGIDIADYSGRSVSGAGDVNGDGLADLIVGAYGATLDDENRAGQSYVVFGKPDSNSVNLENLETGGFCIDGINSSDRSGFSVSGAGDVNGDGLADLIIGAPYADPSERGDAGESYVIFGKNDSASVNLANLGADGFRILGSDLSGRSGRSVSGAGDVNGDGLADLLVGAFGANQSYVVFGKPDFTSVDLDNLGTGGFRIVGADSFDFAGFSVSGAGDVNGDGLADLIIGANYADGVETNNSGESYVVFGKSNNEPVELGSLGTGGFRINGIKANDRSGSSVSGAGDVNGDGLADLIIGAYRADPNGNDSGQSYVVFGKTDSATVNLDNLGDGGFFINGIDGFDRSGVSVSGAGDVNGDGIADVIVGAYRADPNGSSSGESYVVFGPGPGITPGVPAEAPGTVTSPSSIAVPVDPAPIVVGEGDGTGGNPARTTVDFLDGNLARVTVEIDKSTPLPLPFIAGTNAAPVIWEVSTTRTFTSADVTFQYTDAEIAGLDEGDLRLYTASSVGGPWTELPTTIDAATNRATATVSSFSFFLLSDVAGLPVELDTFLVE